MKRLIIAVAFILLTGVSFGQKVEKYLKVGKIEKALNYCEKQNGQEKEICFLHIANYYYDLGDIHNAEIYYQKSNNPEMGYLNIAELYLSKKEYNKSVDFYLKAGEAEELIYNRIADTTFSNNEYDTAIDYYDKAGNKFGLKKVADMYLSKKEFDKSVDIYLKADEPEELVYNKVADSALRNNMYNKAAEFYEKADNKEGLNKIADLAFENKKYKTALLIYKKLHDADKIALCEELLATITLRTGFWSGEGISFIISEEGTEISSLVVNVYNSLNGYMNYKFDKTIPIVKRDYTYSVLYIGEADSPPFPIEIKGEFSDNLDSIDVTAVTITASYHHSTRETTIQKYPTELTAKPQQ